MGTKKPETKSKVERQAEIGRILSDLEILLLSIGCTSSLAGSYLDEAAVSLVSLMNGTQNAVHAAAYLVARDGDVSGPTLTEFLDRIVEDPLAARMVLNASHGSKNLHFTPEQLKRLKRAVAEIT